MLSLEVDKRVKGQPDVIWDILTDSQCFADAAPDILRIEEQGKESGMQRRIHHKSGCSWDETCKHWEENNSFSMQIDTSNYPLPIASVQRIISMEQLQRNVLIKVRYEYTPHYGPLGFFLDKYRIRPVLMLYARQLIDNFAKKIQLTTMEHQVTAQAILDSKDSMLMTISPGTPIETACQILTNKRIGCVIAINPDQSLAGILSERDVVNGIANSGGTPILHKPASDFMTHDVITCHPNDSITKLMAVMSKKRIRHLPVIDDEQCLTGVISIGDIINYRMAELEQESAVMHQYIEGRKWREVAMQIGRSAATEEYN